MFRDFKTGGYQINKTYLHGDRLISFNCFNNHCL